MKITKTKILSACFIALAIVMSFAITAYASGSKSIDVSQRGVTVALNDQKLTLQDDNGNTVEPILCDGTTYVPARAIGKALGCKVEWDEVSGTVLITDYLSLYQARACYGEKDQEVYAYRIYVPENYDKDKKYPVVVSLHGGGGRGSNNTTQIETSAKFWVDKQRSGEIEDVIVVAPQQPAKYGFFMESDCVNAVTQDVIANFSVDMDRIYLTGVSMGGMGCWSETAKYTDLFAAFVSVAGVYPDSRYSFPVGIVSPAFEGDVLRTEVLPEEYEPAMQQYAKILKDFPIWMLQSEADMMAPVSFANYMDECMKSAGATNYKYDVIPADLEIGHGQTYDYVSANYDIFNWLLSQHK